MMRFFHLTSFLLPSLFIAACSSSSSSSPAPTDSGTAQDSQTTDSGVVGDTGSATDSGTGDTPGDSASGFTLKVEDYLNWCTVSVNGGATSTDAVQTITVPAGTVVNLSADKASATFVWGYWVGTAGNTSASHDTSKTTTVTVTKDMIVQACCPFASSPSTPCPPPS